MKEKTGRKNLRKYDVVITGATGFVGRRLAGEIIKHFPKGKILCFSGKNKFPAEAKAKKAIKSLGLDLKTADFTDEKTLIKFPKYPKLVIYLAAETDTSKRDHRVNDIGLRNFYNSVQENHGFQPVDELNSDMSSSLRKPRPLGQGGRHNTLGNPKSNLHIIYFGTMANVVGRVNCKKPADEKTDYIPTNGYTRTKTKGEKYLIEKCRQDKFGLTILVPGTIYGKGVRKNSLFDILKKGIENQNLPARLNWPGRSALIHVDDAVSAILYLSRINPTPGVPRKCLLYSENLSISNLSEIMHKKMNIIYRPIRLPKVIWGFIAFCRKFIPIFEFILPSGIYNQIWRAGIIVDDAMMVKSGKIRKLIPNWSPKLFKDNVSDVIG